jgi:hypothetical protein
MKDEGRSLELGAVSSVVEHYLDTVGVTGSNPVSRTIFSPAAATYAFSSKTNASDCNTFRPDGLIEAQASDVLFADDNGCLFVKSANVDELPATARTVWERQQEKRLRLDARCAHDRTSPVTARSEPPIAATHFAIT